MNANEPAFAVWSHVLRMSEIGLELSTLLQWAGKNSSISVFLSLFNLRSHLLGQLSSGDQVRHRDG